MKKIKYTLNEDLFSFCGMPSKDKTLQNKFRTKSNNWLLSDDMFKFLGKINVLNPCPAEPGNTLPLQTV